MKSGCSQTYDGSGCSSASPKSAHVFLSSLLSWWAWEKARQWEELKGCWDYAALYFRINSSDLLGWINVSACCRRDPCTKTMRKQSAVCGCTHMWVCVCVCVHAGKGHQVLQFSGKVVVTISEMPEKVKAQQLSTTQGTLRREQSGIGKPIFRITCYDLINILGGSYHMLRS